MEKPATRASPEVGGNRVVSILIVVVLPGSVGSRASRRPHRALTESVRARPPYCPEAAREIFPFKDYVVTPDWRSGRS